MADFEGQTLLITGGATGLGAAVAVEAARAGARVAIFDVNERDGIAVARAAGGRFWRVDVGAAEQWATAVDAVTAELGPVRYAHLNAGIMSRPLDVALSVPPIEDFTLGRYEALRRVNIDGVMFGLQALVPHMARSAGGAVTITSSMGGMMPIPFDPVYSSTKHALVGLVRSLGAAYPSGPVRFNAICPGGFTSDLFPPELHGPDSLEPKDVALEVIDLLLRGATGETRLIVKKDVPARAISPSLG
ncbi:MAG: SDR family NAD(P)-dependent oxidoreductase [Sphingomonadales bacterium]|nr:SDR family NAD(P)-dependent oxidoreductase [Sphingomonadales bacterium]